MHLSAMPAFPQSGIESIEKKINIANSILTDFLI